MMVPSVAVAATGRDWTALPADVLAGLARSLTFLDYMTFRTVCKSWAYSLQDVPPSPQLPYLMFPGEDGESTFLSLPDDKYYRLSVPALRGKVCIGCQHGWLATLDTFAEPALLNPITGQQIVLPSITTLPNIYATYAPDGSPSSYFQRTGPPNDLYYHRCQPDKFHALSFVNIVFSSNPGSGSFTSVALQNACGGVMFTSAGEDRWHLYDGHPWAFDDVIFFRGRFLAVSWNGILYALEIKGGFMEVQVIMDPWTGSAEIKEEIIQYNQRFLVADDATGDLLQVWRNCDWTDDDSCTTNKIKVVRCDQKQNRLISLDDLGDRALFLGVGSSMLLSSGEVRGLRRNCIYLNDNWWDTVYADDVRTWNRDVGIYNMENATFEPYHPLDPRFNWPRLFGLHRLYPRLSHYCSSTSLFICVYILERKAVLETSLINS